MDYDNIEAETDYLLDRAARFPIGSIVERRGETFQAQAD